MKLAAASLLLSAHVCLGQNSVTLAWDPSADSSVTGYKLYYTSIDSGVTAANDAGNTLTNIVTGLTALKTYSFYCVAYNSSRAESVPSNTIQYTVPGTTPTPTNPPPVNLPPATPTTLRAQLVNPHRIDLTWNGDTSASTEIWRATGVNSSFARIGTIPPGAPYYADTSIFKKSTYVYKVRSVNAYGMSGFSNNMIFASQ